MPTWIDIAQAVTTGGAATAVIIVVRMFLQHLRDERDDRETSRRQFLDVITNDLRHQTEAVERLAETLTELNVRLQHTAPIDRTVANVQ